eukprot:COSAG01_NODE_1502_length_10101_cov_6.907119_13_plen_116_part_00
MCAVCRRDFCRILFLRIERERTTIQIGRAQSKSYPTPEFQIFAVLLVIGLLQANRNGIEDQDTFGWFQLIMSLTVLPVVAIVLALGLRGFRALQKEADQEETVGGEVENPMQEAI